VEKVPGDLTSSVDAVDVQGEPCQAGEAGRRPWAGSMWDSKVLAPLVSPALGERKPVTTSLEPTKGSNPSVPAP